MNNFGKIFSIFLFTLFLYVSCKTEENSGYNCNSNNCTAVFSNPQYLTLTDCQSACGSAIASVGYNCVSGSCVSTSSNAQYSTLAACQNECNNNVQTGYNCLSGNCVSITGNPEYSTLYACENDCGVISPGTVIINTNWTGSYVYCTIAYTVVIGLGYSSTDVANEAYFAQSTSLLHSPGTYTKTNLVPGIYYYKAKKTFNSTTCGTGQGIPPTVIKSGSFTITSGQTTTVNTGSLD